MISAFRVILPVKNEERRIQEVLQHYTNNCSLVTIVDNCSSDSTLEIVASLFPLVNIQHISNSGTTETPDWWAHASQFFDTEYVLFASCSEFVPIDLLKIFDVFSRNALADLFVVPRKSITGGQSTDYLYCQPHSLFSRSISYPEVTRLVRWKAVDPLKIHPHDSFRSQNICTRLTLKTTDPQLVIHHFRPKPTVDTLRKHICYARAYAFTKCNSNPFYAIADSSLRTFLDTSRIVRAFVDRRLNRITLEEYSLRLLMHLQVIWFSLSLQKPR